MAQESAPTRPRRSSQSAKAKGRQTLTREHVVAAAAEILDNEGIDALSMRSLAAKLGASPGTLYWHVRDRDDLLILVLDDTLRTLEVGTDGPWKDRLLDALANARTRLLARPSLCAFLWSSGWDLGPDTLRAADAIVALVAESGLPDEEVSDAYFDLIVFLTGFVTAESLSAGRASFRESPHDDVETRFPNLVRYAPEPDGTKMERRFIAGARRLINGIGERSPEPPPLTARRPSRRRSPA